MNRPTMVVAICECESVHVVEERVEFTLVELCHSAAADDALVAELLARIDRLERGGGA